MKTNPYEPVGGEFELVETRKPRTTRAFRVAMWSIGIVAAIYVTGISVIDRIKYSNLYFFQETPIGSFIYDCLAW